MRLPECWECAQIYRIGGAQAIAALAYGTQSIPRVDKIVGPGNLYVTAAKKLVSFDCAIDFLAGPTEVVIVSDTGKAGIYRVPTWWRRRNTIRKRSQLFITTRDDLARRVARAAEKQSRRNAVARQALRRNGIILVSASRRQSL